MSFGHRERLCFRATVNINTQVDAADFWDQNELEAGSLQSQQSLSPHKACAPLPRVSLLSQTPLLFPQLSSCPSHNHKSMSSSLFYEFVPSLTNWQIYGLIAEILLYVDHQSLFCFFPGCLLWMFIFLMLVNLPIVFHSLPSSFYMFTSRFIHFFI